MPSPGPAPTLPLTDRGIALVREGQFAKGADAFQAARAAGEDGFERLHELGLDALRRGVAAEAERWLAAALGFRPSAAAALRDHGIALRRLGRRDAALARFDAAVTASPGSAEAHVSRANVLNDLQRWAEALEAAEAALALQPGVATALNAAGNALVGLGRAQEALVRYEQAAASAPDFADPLVNIGNILMNLQRPREAEVRYQAGLRLAPRSGLAWTGYANALAATGRWAQAAAAYVQALEVAPEAPLLHGRHLHARMKICDWRGFDAHVAAIREGLRAGRLASPPFSLLALPSSPAEQRRCAELWIAGQYGGQVPQPPLQPATADGRICVGYFSADFHDHATAHLMADLFETHDRKAFRFIAFSFGPAAPSPMRERLEAAFDEFLDVSGLGDLAVATLSRRLGVEIAVDLKGLTTGARPGIFAQRAAPVQANYIGYPGSMGAPFIDYIIADPVLIPEADRPHYSEKVAYLPGCYQPNDRRRARPQRRSRREDHGLPAEGLVLAAFNNNYKIIPEVWSIWMRLLAQVEGAVLWLFEDNAEAAANLRAAAGGTGVDPARLVFAPRLSAPDHLERHHHVDLFLDTWPYGAHTTASDALWMGAPLLTRLGDTFAGRVAASLLYAVDMPELVARDAEDYERRALELLRDPTRLRLLRQRLFAEAPSRRLFDTPRLARELEALYRAMHARRLAGLAPDHLTLA